MAKSSSGGFGKFLLGLILGMLLLVAGVGAYLRFGQPPVSVADSPFPFEKSIVHVPLGTRIARESKQPPFGTGEDVFEAGAHVYRQNCASCHGVPGHPVAFAAHMYPTAPQLWQKHTGKSKVVGVSDDDAGETYWKVANGIRLTGMPSFSSTLTDTQMWQVTLLLKNADQQLPDPVMQILSAP